jgi:hypothetical protein
MLSYIEFFYAFGRTSATLSGSFMFNSSIFIATAGPMYLSKRAGKNSFFSLMPYFPDFANFTCGVNG